MLDYDFYDTFEICGYNLPAKYRSRFRGVDRHFEIYAVYDYVYPISIPFHKVTYIH